MKVTQDTFDGICSLITAAIWDACTLELAGHFDKTTPKGLATSVTAQICQNLQSLDENGNWKPGEGPEDG